MEKFTLLVGVQYLISRFKTEMGEMQSDIQTRNRVNAPDSKASLLTTKPSLLPCIPIIFMHAFWIVSTLQDLLKIGVLLDWIAEDGVLMSYTVLTLKSLATVKGWLAVIPEFL